MGKLIIILSFLATAYHAKSQSLNEKKGGLLDSMTTVVTGNSYSDIHSILIAKAGKLIYEQYFNG